MLRFRHWVAMTTLILGSLGLSACDDSVEGALTVHSPIVMKDEKGRILDISSSRKMTIDPDNAGKIGKEELRLKLKENSGKDRKIVLKVPVSQSLPQRNGSILLRGSDVGQQFDLQADVSTVESETPPSQTTASCTLTVSEWICRDHTYTAPDGTIRHEQSCGYESVQKNGRKDVLQHTVVTQVTVHASLFAPASSKVLGSFQGNRRSSQTVTDWESTCYETWGW